MEQREIQSLRASDLLEELQPVKMAAQHEPSFVNSSNLLAEEVLKVAEKQFVLVNKEREHATEEDHCSSGEPLGDEDDDDEFNSFGSHRAIHRNLKYIFFLPDVRKQSLHSIGRALERRKGKYTAEDIAWLLILGSPVKDFDDTVFFKRFPKAIQKASEIRDKVACRHVPLDENYFSDPIRRARKQFIDARVSSLSRKSLHTRCVEPIEADDGAQMAKIRKHPQKKGGTEEGTSKKRFRFH